MSALAEKPSTAVRAPGRLVALAGMLALAGASLALLSWALPAAPPPARSPFGVGMAEATGAGGGLAAWILSLQADYGRRLGEAVAGLRRDGGAWWLVGLSLVYGVLHAAGPGHGKAVVSAYILSSGADLRRGMGVSAAAALVQALVALLLVGVLTLVAGVGPDGFRAVSSRVETLGFLAMSAFGAWLLWRKAGALAAPAAGACGPGCGHDHGPPRGDGLRTAAAAALAGGLRPCSGAILVLVLALSQGLYAVGVAAVLAMAAGTAATTALVAAVAVHAKSLALRVAGGRGRAGAVAATAFEAFVAALVTVLGLLLALGAAGGLGGSLSG